MSNPPTLLERTLALLDEADQTLGEIAEGAGVPRHWLVGLKQRRWDDPGVNRVERLFRYLSERAANDAAA